ncbi:tyrosine-type recombinase/integrase, partial [Desulfovibrio desulfuricans]|nr:tyrosine-type recombinase/integrase [Desulfovibrio desulfuricans]
MITKEQLDEMLQKIIVVNKHTRDFDYTQFNYYSYAVALFIGWYTGLRISETFGLKRSNFDFENNTIKIERRLQYHGVRKKDLHDTKKLKSKKAN